MLRLMVLLQLLPRFSARVLAGGHYASAPLRLGRAPIASLASAERLKVSKLLATGPERLGESVTVKGWVRTVRQQKTFAFIEVNDGSSLKGLQVRQACACARKSEREKEREVER